MSTVHTEFLVFSQLLHIVKTVKAESLLCFPTETLYGLGGLATSQKVADEVFQVKGRPQGAPLPVLFAHRQQVERYLEIPAELEILLEHFWPGPLTVALTARVPFPSGVLDGKGRVAARITSHRLLKTVIDYAGPMIATSANRSGEAPAMSAEACLHLQPDAIIMDDPSTSSVPSTVIGWDDGELRVYREGVIPEAQLRAVFIKK